MSGQMWLVVIALWAWVAFLVAHEQKTGGRAQRITAHYILDTAEQRLRQRHPRSKGGCGNDEH
jgi:hypothetical protein